MLAWLSSPPPPFSFSLSPSPGISTVDNKIVGKKISDTTYLAIDRALRDIGNRSISYFFPSCFELSSHDWTFQDEDHTYTGKGGEEGKGEVREAGLCNV